MWEFMASLSEKRLPFRLAASEGAESDNVGVEIDLCSDEPMQPAGDKGEGVPRRMGNFQSPHVRSLQSAMTHPIMALAGNPMSRR